MGKEHLIVLVPENQEENLKQLKYEQTKAKCTFTYCSHLLVKILEQGKDKETVQNTEDEIKLLCKMQEGKHCEIIEYVELNNEMHLEEEERKCWEDSKERIKKIIGKIRKFKIEVK